MNKLSLHTDGWSSQKIILPNRLSLWTVLTQRSWLGLALWALTKCGWTEMDMLYRSDLDDQPIDIVILYRNQCIKETYSAIEEDNA